MAYATVADVQARIPVQLLNLSATSQPTTAEVTTRLEDTSLWMDAALRWKYLTPITDASDLKILKSIASAYVAAELVMFQDQYNEETSSLGEGLMKFANQMFAYDPKTGRSNLVLQNSTQADTGEASLAQPVSTFTNPDLDSEDVTPRFFSIGLDL